MHKTNEEKRWFLFRSLRHYQLRVTLCIIDLVFCLWFLLRDDQTFFSRTYRTLHDSKKTAMLLSISNQRILTFFGYKIIRQQSDFILYIMLYDMKQMISTIYFSSSSVIIWYIQMKHCVADNDNVSLAS